LKTLEKLLFKLFRLRVSPGNPSEVFHNSLADGDFVIRLADGQPFGLEDVEPVFQVPVAPVVSNDLDVMTPLDEVGQDGQGPGCVA
jgi:hypothetical protein